MNTTDNTTPNTNYGKTAVLFLSMASASGARMANGELRMIATQRERGSEKAAALNSRVVREFIEIGVAATDYRKRRAIRELLDYLDQNSDVHYVIFPAPVRVSRLLEDFQELMNQFDNRSVVVTFSYGDPFVTPAAREALWLTTEWVRERTLAVRAQRRRKASIT